MKCPFELPVEAQVSVVDSDRRYITGTNGYPFICGDADKDYADYIVAAINSHEKLVKHVEALKSVCETYIPADKMDEANNEVILFCMGTVEEAGRKLLAKQALKESEKPK